MPIRSSPAYINWELLGNEAAFIYRRQPGWLAAGLAGPLAITGYTMLRRWIPQHGMHDLLQAALFLCGWNILFGLIYACSAWLRPGQETVERELRQLPLSTTHFTLRRLLHSSAVPLAAAALSLPLWLALLCYFQLPYGTGGDLQRWFWMDTGWRVNPWWPRMAWLAGAILSSALLPAALAGWLGELVPARYVRCVLLCGIPAGMYFAVRLASGSYDAAYGYWDSYGPFLMNYRQTRGVSPWPYAALLAVCLLGPPLIGWLRPVWRWALLCLPVFLLGGFMLRRALPESVRTPLRPISTALFSRDTRYAGGLFVGHLSPPLNVRLLLHSYPSNVLFARRGDLEEPVYPEEDEYINQAAESDTEYLLRLTRDKLAGKAPADSGPQVREDPVQRAAYNTAITDYYTASEAYDAQKAAWPRIALWVGAGVYPLLFPIWAIIGLCLGIAARRELARDS